MKSTSFSFVPKCVRTLPVETDAKFAMSLMFASANPSVENVDQAAFNMVDCVMSFWFYLVIFFILPHSGGI